MCRRIDIEPDDVAQFVDEARIVGQLELAHPVRLQTMGAPDRVGPNFTLSPATPSPSRRQSSGSSHQSRVAKRQGDHALRRPSALDDLILEGRVLSRTRPMNPSSTKRSCQRQTQVLDLARSPHDLVRADAIGGQQHDFSPPDVLLRRVAVLHHSFVPANIGGRNGEDFPAPIALNSHVEPASEIPARTEMLGSIHSHVRRFKLQARIFFCSRSSVSDRPPLGGAKRHDHENDG